MPNMEGKEVRFGVGGSVLTAITTSNGATGSYNSMHDSYTPLGGGVALGNMLLGEIVFGGLGTGLYSIILIALIGLFLAGLMIGRTPEYLGKTIGIHGNQIHHAVHASCALGGAGADGDRHRDKRGAGRTHNQRRRAWSYLDSVRVRVLVRQQRAELRRPEREQHLLQRDDRGGNDGWAVRTGDSGARAGRLFRMQQRRPTTLGTLPAYTFTFGVLVVGTALIVGGLSYFPALALGPIIEHLLMSYR